MLSGGSNASTSVTPAASTVTVQSSPCVKSVLGLSVNAVLGLALVVNVCAPEVAQEIVKLAPLALTDSLKLTVTSAFAATPVAPLAGVVLLTAGDASTWMVNEHEAERSLPPFAVPPLSRRRMVTFADPVVPATGVNVSVPLELTAGWTLKRPGLVFPVTSNVSVWADSFAEPALMPVAQPAKDAAPAELSAVTVGPQEKLGGSLTGLTVIVTVAVFEVLEPSLAV